jgi:hypothetical protein
MEDKKFLDRYTGQTVRELIKLEADYRIDSLILAFEQGIDQKAARIGDGHLTKLEKSILAIEALEREVNNGGYSQFFINSSSEYATSIVDSLEYVGLSKTAGITRKALEELKIEGPITSGKIEETMHRDDEGRDEMLGIFDDVFYEYEEDISGELFSFIKNHQDEIQLP